MLAGVPAKRVLISIDTRLLDRVDRAARRKGMTRSGYLADLAIRDIGPGGGDEEERYRSAATVPQPP
jgi:metal-responsive CopG/Arc/MetJ family transcriptional regulator